MEKKTSFSYKKNLHHGAKPEHFEFAEKLRKRMTEAEVLLWKELKNKKLGGYKFRRQHPFGRFVLDFYCQKKKLCVELDGGYHDSKMQKDADIEREEILKEMGVNVIRFKNKEVIENLDFVLVGILGEFYCSAPL